MVFRTEKGSFKSEARNEIERKKTGKRIKNIGRGVWKMFGKS